MRASAAEMNLSEERLKEYQRQQERLKAVTTNADKVKSMSADVMIENLLKQNFVKPSTTNLENRVKSGSGLPNWLECESAEMPAAYKNLWAFVKTPTNFADTQKVSQLLLTSGLHMEVLGFIWNLSNRAVPGQLNKQEFYIVLALVALAQSGYTFNNLSILNLVPNAPIPSLQTKVLEKFVRSPNASNIMYVSQVSPVRPVNEEILQTTQLPPSKINELSSFGCITMPTTSAVSVNEPLKSMGEIKSLKKFPKSTTRDPLDFDSTRDFPKTSHFPCIGSSPTAELEEEDDFSEFQSATINEPAEETNMKKEDSSFSSQSDEFTDFQCADISDPLETVVISQKKEIPKIPLPRNLTGKLSSLRTNILKISPESEKKLKVLTQSETLSTLPESKISTNNKVSTMSSISVLPSNRDIGMRLANHSLGSKTDKSRHQRHKHKQAAHADEMMFPSKFGTMDDLFPKCFQKTSGGSKTFVLKETKIGSTDAIETEPQKSDTDAIADLFPPGKNTRKIEIPMLGTFNETTLPTQAENVHAPQPTVKLFSVEEDKYSALREVELEMKLKNNEMKQCESNANVPPSDGIDDFGEFLSAEIPPAAPAEETDLWGDWSDPSPAPQTINTDQPTIEMPFESVIDDVPKANDDFKTIENSANTLNFDLLTLTEEDNAITVPTLPELGLTLLPEVGSKKNIEDSTTMTTELGDKEEGDKQKIIQDFGDFMVLDNSKVEETNQSRNNFQMTGITNNMDEDFGMFFTSEYTPPPPLETNRDDLLPSLNLKMLSPEGNEQETIRKKCLVACLNLIQQGLDIFNGVTTTTVLSEVLSTQEAVIYLNNLNIVYQISRRVGANAGEVLSIQEDIDRAWQKLVRYCCDYQISLKEDLDNNARTGTQCHVCLGFIGNDIIDKGAVSYHPTCANLWVNCVESELPCPI